MIRVQIIHTFSALARLSAEVIPIYCAGIYPIAQLREPYSSVQFLAERLDLPALLALEPPEDYFEAAAASSFRWSAYAICEGLLNINSCTR